MSIPSIIRYPYDSSGTALTNRITNEIHTVPRSRNRAFALVEGPFYGESVVVTWVSTNQQLVRNVDFELLYLHQEATVKTAKAVYCICRLINPDVVGDVSVDYQVVGGQYSSNFAAIQMVLDSLNLDTRPVAWQNIIGLPVEFPPSPHLHHAAELYGMEHVVEALNQIALILESRDSNELTGLIARVDQLDVALSNLTPRVTGLEQRVRPVAISGVTNAQINRRYHVMQGALVQLPALSSVALYDEIVFSHDFDGNWTLKTNDIATTDLLEWLGVTDSSANVNINNVLRVMKKTTTRWVILK